MLPTAYLRRICTDSSPYLPGEIRLWYVVAAWLPYRPWRATWAARPLRQRSYRFGVGFIVEIDRAGAREFAALAINGDHGPRPASRPL